MFFEELKLGQKLILPGIIVDKQELLEFSAKYDNIPLHTDEAYAAQTRFKGLIAPGIMTYLLVWVEYLKQDFFGEALVAGKSLKIDWLLPVYPGDELKGEIFISNLSNYGHYNGLVETTLQVCNQRNEKVMECLTHAVVRKKPLSE